MRTTSQNKRLYDFHVPNAERVCVGCGKPYTAKAILQKNCTKKCYNKTKYQKDKLKAKKYEATN